MRNLIIASTSTLYKQKSLEYLKDELVKLYSGAKEIVFIPYARPGGISHENYTQGVRSTFKQIGISVKGLHEFKNPIDAVEQSEGIYVGGGNTFVLVNELYKHQLIIPLINAIKNGVPYLGTSAGSNICGLSMKTTNDMPIVYPPSFKTLGILPFNINPHYQDPDTNSHHMGETREQRIKEFHSKNTTPVVGLREGSWLRVKQDQVMLEGPLSARIFEYEKPPYELAPGSNLKELK